MLFYPDAKPVGFRVVDELKVCDGLESATALSLHWPRGLTIRGRLTACPTGFVKML